MCREKIHKMLKINTLRAFFGPFLGWRLARFSVLAALGCFFCVFSAGCGDGSSREVGRKNAGPSCADSVAWDSLQYSRMFRLGHACGDGVVEVRSIVGRDTLVRRVVVKEPFRRVVVLSSAQIGFMVRLGAEDRIVAVGEGKYVVDSSLYAKVESGGIAEVGNGPSISLEKVVALKPDLLMTFATGGSFDDYERLLTLGIPLLVSSEWQEDHPLAKMEWIKLFGMIFGKETLADSIYEQTKTDYLLSFVFRLSSKNGGVAGEVSPAEGVADAAGGRSGGEASPCPRVIAGMAYGGVWYAPGGRSYTAQLIRGAGGCYLWESDTTREMRLSLEEVMLLADSADVWVNPGAFGSAEEILAAEPRVGNLRALRERRVIQNDGRKGPGGGNDFYESAVTRPVELVRNLRECIFAGFGGVTDEKMKTSHYKWYRNIYN